MIYVVEKAWHQKTLKDYLFVGLSLSRAQVTALKKKENGILLNGLHVTVRAVLSEGDRLELAMEDEESAEELVPYDVPLDILYEDEDVVCVNKVQGMPTHPSRGHFEDTLANALAAYYLKKDRPFVFRAVNRLDRDTTGVVLVAKNKRAAAALSEQISKRTVEKEYLALLLGTVKEDCGSISKNIVRVDGSLMLRRTDEVAGDEALTTYRVLERKNGMTLVLATPHTGRTHQLRVHFASIGHPIFADSLYGEAVSGMEGQVLHAYRLAFAHPVSAEAVEVKAPLQPNFLKVLKDYGFELF